MSIWPVVYALCQGALIGWTLISCLLLCRRLKELLGLFEKPETLTEEQKRRVETYNRLPKDIALEVDTRLNSSNKTGVIFLGRPEYLAFEGDYKTRGWWKKREEYIPRSHNVYLWYLREDETYTEIRHYFANDGRAYYERTENVTLEAIRVMIYNLHGWEEAEKQIPTSRKEFWGKPSEAQIEQWALLRAQIEMSEEDSQVRMLR